jgi:carboxyl-terminal processing protease
VALISASQAAAAPLVEVPRLPDWRGKAADAEGRGAWLLACRYYDEALRRNRNDGPSRAGYRRCLRRLYLALRHRDPNYRHALRKLTPPQVLDVYEQVLAVVPAAYVERSRTNLNDLFRHGLDELRFALDDEAFRQQYLAGVKPAALTAFKSRLLAWPARRLAHRGEAREQVLAVVRAAQRDGIPIKPGLINAVGFEFAAGACNALDEYTSFLTPGNFRLVQLALRGKLVGVGLDLSLVDDKVLISRVYPKGPAAEAGLLENDRVVSIDRQRVEELTAEFIADRLRGLPGTAVEVEVVRAAEPGRGRRVVKLVRRAVAVPSVESKVVALDDSGTLAGYLRITHFQESTLHEVQEALLEMQGSIKGLILDLRGNPGGLFKSGVGVSELFLTDGVVVVSQSPFKDYNRAYKVEAPGGVPLPLVVLVDGETASAAEVLAGALVNRRAPTRLVGQTTFGKGSIQCVVPLDRGALEKMPAGIRITVAKLFSPSGQPYTGRGIVPHEVVDVEGEAGLEAGKKSLATLITPPGIM